MTIIGSLKNHTHPELNIIHQQSETINKDISKHYMRFPDGTMICIAKMQFSPSLNKNQNHIIKESQAVNSGWQTYDHTQYRHMVPYYISLEGFKDVPVTFTQNTQNHWVWTDTTVQIIPKFCNKDKVQFCIFEPSSVTNIDFDINLLIIGRWK